MRPRLDDEYTTKHGKRLGRVDEALKAFVGLSVSFVVVLPLRPVYFRPGAVPITVPDRALRLCKVHRMGDRIFESHEGLGTVDWPNRQIARLMDEPDNPCGRVGRIGLDQDVSVSGGWRLRHPSTISHR